MTWNDYEEGTEIESGISNCLTISATASGNTLQWSIQGNSNTVDHYVAYVSTDGQNLMPMPDLNVGTGSMNLCSYSVPNGSYTFYVQAVGKPGMTNQISGAVTVTSTCVAGTTGSSTFSLGTNPSSMTISSGGSGNLTVTAASQSGAFNNAIALTCSGLPQGVTCSFSPASITPGSGSVNSVLTIAATTIVSADHGDRGHFLAATWLFSFGVFGLTLIGKVQRKRLVTVLGACVLAAMIVGATSCGGSSTSSPAKASNASSSSYIVTINGNASSVQLATTVTVTVR